LGGIGKTQLASEFVHRYGRYFEGGAFWVSFGAPDSIPAEIASCGGAAALDLRPDVASLPLADQVGLVSAAWQGPLPRLLVFDNCEDAALLAQWRPPTGNSRVLVTSRRAEWSRALGVRTLPLGVLERGESIALLREHRPELGDDDPDLAAIAEELGDLPLALHLAGSFLERYRHADFGAPAAYLARLRRPDLLEHRSLTEGDLSPTGHDQHVARTFALSRDRLDPADATDEIAVGLLSRAACFAPGEPIPRDLLSASLDLAEAESEGGLDFEDALRRLTDLGLMDAQADGALVLHRLLAAFARAEAEDAEEARSSVEAAVLAAAQRLNQEGYPAPLLAWQPHLRAVAENAATTGSEQAGGLHNELGAHLRMVADFAGARAAFERALTIAEKALGPDHPDVAAVINNLGNVLQDHGDLVGARTAYERALAIDESTFGPDHPEVATGVNNLRSVLHDQGDLAGARAAFERALAIDEVAFGPDHPKVAIRINNLGNVLQEKGNLAGARTAYERALAIDEKAFGPDHPKVASGINNLGGVLQSEGDLAGARAAYERALSIDETAFGPDHPQVATVVNNLGLVLKTEGDLAGARAAFERALAIFEKVLGNDHPDTMAVRGNLDIVNRL
ncbi:MAG: tetratricopeptide repeat protein, partial [Kiloniellales bacterium]